MNSGDEGMPPTWGCIYVELSSGIPLPKLCEEAYRAFLNFFNKGMRRIRIYVGKPSKASDWVGVSSCVLTQNLVATVEVYAVEELDRNEVVRECVELVEVPVAPPTSLVRERRQVIP